MEEDSNRNTILSYCAIENNYTLFKYITRKYSNLIKKNQYNSSGNSFIHLLVIHKETPLNNEAMLIDALYMGFNKDIKNNFGKTPIDCANESNYFHDNKFKNMINLLTYDIYKQ